MKIKLAILDKDVSYLNQITNAFHGKLQDSVEIHSFTDFSDATKAMKSLHIDVLLVDSSFTVDMSALPKDCGFAYLMDSPNIHSYNGRRACFRYQKTESLLNFITDVYAESCTTVISVHDGRTLPLYIFTSASGGVGVSTVAVSCARKFASIGRSPIYLNLEKLGNPILYFNGSTNFTMSDVIFAVKSKRPNLAIKLKSNIQRDTSGVYWFPAPKNPLDLLEINKEDIFELLDALSQTGLLDCIVADVPFNLDDISLSLFQAANTLVFVTDGSKTANDKFNSAYSTLLMIDKEEHRTIASRVAVLYNKFSNKSGEQLDIHGLKVIGGIPKCERATTQQLIAQMLKMEVFTAL